MTKVCSKCQKLLSVDNFRKDATRKRNNGYEYVCKGCKVDKREKLKNKGLNELPKIPILLEFDSEKVIGYVQMTEEYLLNFPEVVLSAAVCYSVKKPHKKEIWHFGLIRVDRKPQVSFKNECLEMGCRNMRSLSSPLCEFHLNRPRHV